MRALGALFLATAGLAASSAAAQTPGEGRSVAERLAAARDLLEQIELADAARAASDALSAGGATLEQMRGALEVLALARAGMDEHDAAVGTFEQLLAIAPDFRLAEGTSPKVRRAFERARRRGPVRPIRLEARPQALRGGQEGIVELRIDDSLGLVVSLALHSRFAPGESFRALAVAGPFPALARLPIDAAARTLELWLSGLDDRNNEVAREGSGEHPFSFPVQPGERGPSIATRWWFWTAIAVVAGGIAVSVWAISTVR